MMYLVLTFATAALLSGCRSANVNRGLHPLSALDNIESNELPTKTANLALHLTMTQRPKSSYALKQGDILHLPCEALGSPSPSVRWFKNDAPIFEYDMESNELIDSNPSSVARVSSTLLVAHSGDRDRYSCLVASGSKTIRSSTTVYNVDGSTEFSERSKLYPLTPQVVVWYKIYVDTIGNNVVLPCRVKGHPRPHIAWTDNKGTLVKNHPTMKVLRSGQLVISVLRWVDMGEFTCHATNMFGTATATTFVYPAKAS